jgi:DNA mismatch endonuclease (patch repair protein)
MKKPRKTKGKNRPLTRSEIMGRVKGKNSGAEKTLRSALHARGLRFRLHRRIEGVSVDILIPGPKVAIFVDGCFWHCCPEHGTTPQSNQEYWLPKLKENRQRDERQNAGLQRAGWKVIRVWEHDCKRLSEQTVGKIVEACRSRSRQ